MANSHYLDGADAALTLIDHAHSVLLAAHAAAEFDGRRALAGDLRVFDLGAGRRGRRPVRVMAV